MRVFRLFFVRASVFILAFSLFLSLVFPVPVYAGVATSSDAEFEYGDMVDGAPYAAGLSVAQVANTVDSYSGAHIALQYISAAGNNLWVSFPIDSDGHFNFRKPANFSKPLLLEIFLPASSFPELGKYAMALNVLPDTGITYKGGKTFSQLYSRYRSANSSPLSKVLHFIPSSVPVESISSEANGYIQTRYSGGGYVVEYNDFGQYYGNLPSVVVTNKSSDLRWGISITDISFPASGDIRVSFSAVNTEPVFTTPGTTPTDAESLSGISNTVGAISSGVSQVVSGVSDVANKVSSVTQAVNALPNAIAQSMEPHYNNVLTQLHHITEQLHAFWNQLAAYFNDKLIPQMITDTNRIVDAINSLDLEVDVSLSELTSVLNKNHQEQLDNDNKNHQAQLDNDDKNADAIMNSYDNSSFTSSNQNLSDSLTQYEDEESRLLEQVQGNINNMEYADPFSQLAGPLADFSFFLTGIYTGLGVFNIPIAFSLTLTIALLCIGWYRFRGG